MDFSPHDIRYFVEIAHTGNISRASERLGVSQPAVSVALKRLEQQLGTLLFVRNKGGITLTRPGQKLVAKAHAILQEWDGIRKSVINADVEVSGTYTIGCHVSVSLYTLPDLVGSLLHTFPALELKFSHDLSRCITEDIISYKLDFGIVVNPVRHNDLVIDPLGSDTVTFWAADKASALQNPIDGRAVLIYDPSLVQSQWLLSQVPKLAWQFHRRMTTGSLELIAALVAAGAGIGVLPGRVAALNRPSKLQILHAAAPAYLDQICLVYRADLHTSKASRLLINAIKAKLHADFGPDPVLAAPSI